MDHQPPPLEGAVFAALDRLTAGASGPLCLAVSGGGDSMALLHLAARWGRARARAVTAASVDHGLRAAARGESAAVAWQARALDLPHWTL
ncbi:MAG: ATP-binding protein, partial [Pseudomonadota bacterium]